jgi:hypothetical protein
MPSEPQEIISKKTIMKETEKPATRKVALCGGSGEGRPVSRATRRGGRRVHVEKHTIQWEKSDFLNEKRTKFAPKLYTKFY